MSSHSGVLNREVTSPHFYFWKVTVEGHWRETCFGWTVVSLTEMGKKVEPGVWGGLGFRQGAFEGGKTKQADGYMSL